MRISKTPQVVKDVWTDSNQGPIQFLAHHPNEKKLVLGAGNEVLLLEYGTQGGLKTVCRGKHRLPSPPQFPEFQEELPKPIGRSAHFIPEKGVVVVSYLHHGIV